MIIFTSNENKNSENTTNVLEVVMKGITDDQGKPTTLKPGNCIGFIVEEQALILMPEYGDGNRLRWPDGDDKNLAKFLNSEDDFRGFAIILAETHGLSIKERERLAHPGICVCEFVEA